MPLIRPGENERSHDFKKNEAPKINKKHYPIYRLPTYFLLFEVWYGFLSCTEAVLLLMLTYDGNRYVRLCTIGSGPSIERDGAAGGGSKKKRKGKLFVGLLQLFFLGFQVLGVLVFHLDEGLGIELVLEIVVLFRHVIDH